MRRMSLRHEMIKIKGKEATTRFCDSQAAAVDRIEEIQKKEKIDCDFRRLDGYLFRGRVRPPLSSNQEMDAVREVGAPVDRLVGLPLNGCEDRHVLRYPRQATFHPSIPCRGGEGLQQNWCGVFPRQPGKEVTQDDGMVTVKTARGVIRAEHAVVATNSSISDRFAIHTKTAGPDLRHHFEIKRGALPDALYWIRRILITMCAAARPFENRLCSGRRRRSQVGEADNADDRFRNLEDWARGLISRASEGDVIEGPGQAPRLRRLRRLHGRDPGGEKIYVGGADPSRA